MSLSVFNEDNTVNIPFIENIRNNVIICDEIHSSYASENNTYGEALQVISNYLQNDIQIIYMSATPLLYSKNVNELKNYLHIDERYADIIPNNIN